MKKLILFFVLYISCTRFVGATGQMGEVIIIGQDTLGLLSCPIEVDAGLSRKVSDCTDALACSTACWRGYIGWWRLENGTLYLEKIVAESRDSLGREILIDTKGIFDAYKQDGKIVASWFSGELRVVKGKCISYEHAGFWRDYEEEWTRPSLSALPSSPEPAHAAPAASVFSFPCMHQTSYDGMLVHAHQKQP